MIRLLCQLAIPTSVSALALYMLGYYDMEPAEMVEWWREIFSALGL